MGDTGQDGHHIGVEERMCILRSIPGGTEVNQDLAGEYFNVLLRRLRHDKRQHTNVVDILQSFSMQKTSIELLPELVFSDQTLQL